MFTKENCSPTFDILAIPGDSVSITTPDGFTVTATIHLDEGHGAPWDEEEGHGPVSEWTTRDPEPGERVLNSDRRSYRYYDFDEAVKIALRDGWSYGEGTPEERARAAVEEDYKRLKAWCDDEWRYIGVVLSVSRAGITLDDNAASLWGFEDDAGAEYIASVCNDLLPEAVEAGKAALAKLIAST